MAKRLALAATVLTFVLAPTGLNAETIVVTFIGTIFEVNPNPFFPVDQFDFAVGDPVSGRIQYESDAIDAVPDPNIGLYAAANGTIQVGSHVYNVSAIPSDCGGCGVHIENNSGFGDEFFVQGTVPEPERDPDFSLGLWSIFLADRSGTVFSDDSLPTSLTGSDFDFDFGRSMHANFLGVEGSNSISFGSVFARLTHFVVPEPATGLLFIAGLLGLALASRRRNPLN